MAKIEYYLMSKAP